MLNNVTLVGRLARDPEIRYSSSGVAVCGFTLAVNRPYRNEDGEQDADFIDIVVFRDQAETCANYLSKGRLVAVEGRLQTRRYETQDGQRRKAVEVVARRVTFLDRRPDSQDGDEGAEAGDSGLPQDVEDILADLPPEDVPF